MNVLNKEVLINKVRDLEPADLAAFIEDLKQDERISLVKQLPASINGHVLTKLDDIIKAEIIDLLTKEDISKAISHLKSEEIVDLIKNLPQYHQEIVLSTLPESSKSAVRLTLGYPEKSVGRLMSQSFVAAPDFWSIEQILNYLKQSKILPEAFSEVFIVDPRYVPVGIVTLSQLLRSTPTESIQLIMNKNVPKILATLDQEDAAHVFIKNKIRVAAVTDSIGRLLGIIKPIAITEVINEENEEDLLAVGGVSSYADNTHHAPLLVTCSARLRWLLVALLNAVISSVVIAQFQDTIKNLVILAILMPTVASLGGNVGVQSISVMVRSLAAKKVRPENLWRTIRREALVAGMNGLVIGALLSIGVALYSGSPFLGIILTSSMVFNMTWSGLIGATLPILIERCGLDPALGAGPILTTITDTSGFVIFLGLARLFL